MLKRLITILLLSTIAPSIIATTTLSAYAYPSGPIRGR